MAEITAQRGAGSGSASSSSPRALPARPGPRKGSVHSEPPRRLHLPRTSITSQPQPRSFITSPPLTAHPSAPPQPTSSAGSTPSPGRVPRPPAGTELLPPRVSQPRPPPVPAETGRALPPEPGAGEFPAAGAAALPGRGAGLPVRTPPGSSGGRSAPGFAVLGPSSERGGCPRSAEPFFCSARGPRQRRVPSPAPGPGARSGRCRTAFPQPPGTVLAGLQSVTRGPGLLSPPSLGQLSLCGVLSRSGRGSPASGTERSEPGSQEGAALAKDAPGVCPASAAAGLH